MKPLCLIWKLLMSPFIFCMVPWPATRGCRVTDQNFWRVCVESSQTPKHIWIIPISWTTDRIFISVGSPECPLSDAVWKHTQLQETAKWQAESWDTSCFHPTQALFCLLPCTVRSSWGLHPSLLILGSHSVNPWSISSYHIPIKRGHSELSYEA